MTLPDVLFSTAQRLNYTAATGEHPKDRIKILCLSLWYPLSMSRYFEKAFRRNPNVEFVACGVYTGAWIPWSNEQNPYGMTLPEKYAKSPELPLPFQPNVQKVNYEFVETQLQGWKPDLIVTIDAGINWADKPKGVYSVTVGTDPHVLDYSHARRVSDKFFSMQKCYSEPTDIYLPYAYSKYDHYPQERYVPAVFKGITREDGSGVDRYTGDPYKDTDAMLIGLQYTHIPRVAWMEELRKHGVSVYTENGAVFDEYRAIANRARIGLNWSTMNDLNARFFETPAFGLPMVANRVPDAHLFLDEGNDYLAFSTLPEAVDQVLYLKNNPDEARKIAENGYKKIQPHTYDARVQQILEECRL